MNTKSSKVFLSYSWEDRIIASTILRQLYNQNISVYDPAFADTLINAVHNSLSASDCIIILLSNYYSKSKWCQKEFEYLINSELNLMDISVYTIIIDDCDIPKYLNNSIIFDLRSSNQLDLNLLTEKIKLALSIDFSTLNGFLFEKLVVDLLLKNNAFNIIQNNFTNDIFDLLITSRQSKPLYYVNLKFYHSSKADFKSLYNMYTYINQTDEKIKGLLITNSRLTSASQEWINKHNVDKTIEVIDGTALRKLLLTNTDLIYKYFIQRERVET